MRYYKKICNKCKKEKGQNAFPKDKRRKGKRATVCKQCDNENNRKAQVVRYSKYSFEDNPYTNARMKYQYGITVKEYINMAQFQNDVCAICGEKETRKSSSGNAITRLSVDHDHKTGKVRGLLCYKCNTMLGSARDNIEILERAISYLRESSD